MSISSSAAINKSIAAPVLLSFFVMSFCDLIGLGVDNAKADFNLSNTLANMIPLAVFIWFLILSVPVGIAQDRIGKKNMVNIGMIITAVGLLIPFLMYSYVNLLIGFVLLGIGNTILQVSANPLLIDIVPEKGKASFLSYSQFIKAIGSMIAPYVASWFASQYGDWKMAFLTFGIVSLITAIWLHFTTINESKNTEERASIGSVIKLLAQPYVVVMVLSIFFVVGLDVGINAVSGQFLISKFNMDLEPASQGRSLYFFGKMLGTFIGGMILSKVDAKRFLLYSTVATTICVLLFIWSPSTTWALAMMFVIGFVASVIFPLVFALLADRYSIKINEISGLIIMAVCGGAFIPPIAAKIADMSSVSVSLYVFVACGIYMILASLYALKEQKK
ncbi:MAG: MFS transporter [Saprospiraceae bacterium]|jgi:FHS family L-fucose permease-like MFS transporter|nr:MFS transporter [Saprospiraceae bacterium]MBP6446175.1 MFS transporter [Saprospiraceae bacterium]